MPKRWATAGSVSRVGCASEAITERDTDENGVFIDCAVWVRQVMPHTEQVTSIKVRRWLAVRYSSSELAGE